MLNEWVQYKGKAGFFKWIFKIVFLKILASKTRRVYAQTVTYLFYAATEFEKSVHSKETVNTIGLLLKMAVGY